MIPFALNAGRPCLKRMPPLHRVSLALQVPLDVQLLPVRPPRQVLLLLRALLLNKKRRYFEVGVFTAEKAGKTPLPKVFCVREKRCLACIER